MSVPLVSISTICRDKKKLVVDFVRVERSEIEETGEYDLEGLFVRLAYAIDSIGAKRVVLDTIENLFSGFFNEGILRAELRRLFYWLKEKGMTAVITGERGERAFTRHGLEEYISDCVILLDHRMVDQISTRRLRIVKYRGTPHFTNEYPFLIGEDGINLLPITSAGLQHRVSSERISSGIARLDTMLDGHGYYRGSTVLVSGTAGTGKSSVAAHFAHAACRRGEGCLYVAFEESPGQIIRNMRSIGLDLEHWVRKGLLHFHDISSLVDTWLLLKEIELSGERNRVLYVHKSRGMAHSNQIREFLITSDGIDLVDVYAGPEGVLTGSARRITAMRKEFDLELQRLIDEDQATASALAQDRQTLALKRRADADREFARSHKRSEGSQ